MKVKGTETIKVSFEIKSALGLDFFNSYDNMVESLRNTAERSDIKNVKYKVVGRKKDKPKQYLQPGWYERSDMPIDGQTYVLHVKRVEDGRSWAQWFHLGRREYNGSVDFALDLTPNSYTVENGYTFRELVAEEKIMVRYKAPVAVLGQ